MINLQAYTGRVKGLRFGYAPTGHFLLFHIEKIYPNKNVYSLSDKSIWILQTKARVKRYKKALKHYFGKEGKT